MNVTLRVVSAPGRRRGVMFIPRSQQTLVCFSTQQEGWEILEEAVHKGLVTIKNAVREGLKLYFSGLPEK